MRATLLAWLLLNPLVGWVATCYDLIFRYILQPTLVSGAYVLYTLLSLLFLIVGPTQYGW